MSSGEPKIKFDPEFILTREQTDRLAKIFRDSSALKNDKIESDLIESLRLTKKYPDQSTRDHQCPMDSPYCRTHFQKLRCMNEGVHVPEHVPRVEIKIFHKDSIHMEMKIFMEGKTSPIAFATIKFESTEGARAFADSLEQHGVVGYAVYLDR